MEDELARLVSDSHKRKADRCNLLSQHLQEIVGEHNHCIESANPSASSSSRRPSVPLAPSAPKAVACSFQQKRSRADILETARAARAAKIQV